MINTTFDGIAKNTQINPKLRIMIDNFEEGSAGLIVIKANETYSGEVTVRISGTFSGAFTISVSNGEGNRTIYLPAGDYAALAESEATGDFANASASTTFQVTSKPVPAKTVPDEKISTDNELTIIVLPSDATGTITVFVDGVKYAVLNIVNGIAKIDLSKFKNGNHLIRFVYSGDAKYTSFTNEITTTAPEETIKLTLSKVKVRKSAKKLVLKATLKINGKAKNGVKVTFKFNGKKFTAKTNTKGVAKLIIKKKILKKLKVGKKIKIQAMYKDKISKFTVKVKK